MTKTMSACPNCNALNNIDTEKAKTGKATCGKCGTEIIMHGLVSEVTGENMQRIINKADKVVIVDFWASWCQPCQIYGPEFQKASTENPDTIFLKVNTEHSPHTSQHYGIRGIPATLIFKNGQEVKRQSGVLNSNMIKNILKDI